jgi:hypothetical protein
MDMEQTQESDNTLRLQLVTEAIKCSKLEQQRDAMNAEIVRLLSVIAQYEKNATTPTKDKVGDEHNHYVDLLAKSDRLRNELVFAEQMSKAFSERNKELVIENIELRRRWNAIPFAAIRAVWIAAGGEAVGAWLESIAKPDSIADGPTAFPNTQAGQEVEGVVKPSGLPPFDELAAPHLVGIATHIDMIQAYAAYYAEVMAQGNAPETFENWFHGVRP